MKKRIFLTLAVALVLALAFALSVFADETTSVHNGKVDLNATVTLDDGTVCPLYDEDGDALIWYISGNDENGKNVYSSIKTQDPQVSWYTQWWNEVTDVGLKFNDGTKCGKEKFVVVNMMDDDVVKGLDSNGSDQYMGQPIDAFKLLFMGCKNLEYCYLRLDTTGIFRQSFDGCSKLKYINLEHLTMWKNSRDSGHFSGCTSLFKDQVLDLSKTSLYELSGGYSFNGVPLKGNIFPSTFKVMWGSTFMNSGIESIIFPSTVNSISSSTFENCKSLTTIYIGSNVTKIEKNAFLGCDALENVFYVGSLEQLEAFLPYVVSDDGKDTHVSGVSVTGNDAFLAAVNANKISYVDYQLLDDNSGKKLVYGYSYCEVYGDGECVLSGNTTMLRVDYFKDILFTDTCVNEKCKACMVDKSKTIGALFKDCGYSVTEEAINGRHAMLQCYMFNKEAYSAYVALNTGFEFGIVASVSSDPLNPENSALIAEKKTYITEQSLIAQDYFDIGVVGIGENQTKTKLVFCAYVKDSGETFYLDGGKTVSVAEAVSHFDLASKIVE